MLPRAFQAIACCGSVSHPGPSITPPCQPGSVELDHPRHKHRWQGWQQEGYPDPERLGPPHQLPCGLRPPRDVTGEQPGRDVEHAVDMLFRGQDTADLISNHRVRMGRRHMGGRQASQQNCEGPRTAKRCPQQHSRPDQKYLHTLQRTLPHPRCFGKYGVAMDREIREPEAQPSEIHNVRKTLAAGRPHVQCLRRGTAVDEHPAQGSRAGLFVAPAPSPVASSAPVSGCSSGSDRVRRLTASSASVSRSERPTA